MTPEAKDSINLLSGKPYLMFWLSIPFVLIIGFSGAPQLKFSWNDLSCVIISREFAFLVSMVYMGIGLVYYALLKKGRRLIRILTLMHTFFSLDLALIFWIFYLLKRTSTNGFYEMEITGFSELIIVAIAIGQVLFVINILYSLLTSGSSFKDK